MYHTTAPCATRHSNNYVKQHRQSPNGPAKRRFRALRCSCGGHANAPLPPAAHGSSPTRSARVGATSAWRIRPQRSAEAGAPHGPLCHRNQGRPRRAPKEARVSGPRSSWVYPRTRRISRPLQTKPSVPRSKSVGLRNRDTRPASGLMDQRVVHRSGDCCRVWSGDCGADPANISGQRV